jgi:hypothetical protein
MRFKAFIRAMLPVVLTLAVAYVVGVAFPVTDVNAPHRMPLVSNQLARTFCEL